MGKFDGLMGRYLRDRERFADLINGILFSGERIISPEALEREAGDYLGEVEEDRIYPYRNKDGREQYRAKGIKRRYRDLKMRSGRGGQFQIFSLENQSFVDYTMPLRCMEYDLLEYQEQLTELKKSYKMKQIDLHGAEKLSGIKRGDKLLPVYTICLYHGEAKWDGPRSLSDMIQLGEGENSNRYFSDYPMRLYCINEQKDFQGFHTELRQFFQTLGYRGNKDKLEELIENSVEYQNLSEETFEMIVVFLGMSELWKIREKFKNDDHEGKGYNMCQAIRELRAEERAIGRGIGLTEGLEQGLEQGIRALITTCKRLGVSYENTEESVRREFKLSDDEIVNNMTLYWNKE